MTIHLNYVGCDISKTHLDLFDPQGGRKRAGKAWRVANTHASAAGFASTLAPDCHVILEATGRYDQLLRKALDAAGIAYSRINPTKARRFAEAAGYHAKTDRLDAQMLSEYGQRFEPEAALPIDDARETLTGLRLRRDQLVEARACEKGRRDGATGVTLTSLDDHIAFLDAAIVAIEDEIKAFLKTYPTLGDDHKRLQSAPGVGPVTADVLVAGLPELGHCNSAQIAALAGLAPMNRDSGIRRGKRSIRGGRRRVRRALYMAALHARKAHGPLRNIYQRVLERSGVKKIAIIAVARKLLIILNAMMKNKTVYQS